jgi:hypothetical protein
MIPGYEFYSIKISCKKLTRKAPCRLDDVVTF